MPATKSSDVMKKWFEEVWNNVRGDLIQDMFSEDGVAHGLGPAPIKGPAAFREFWKRFNEVFKNIRIDVRAEVDEGEKTYVRCTGRMNFNGKPVVLEGGCLAHVRGGKIRECWNTWDFVGLFVQMETLPEDVVDRAFEGKRASFAETAGADPAAGDVPVG